MFSQSNNSEAAGVQRLSRVWQLTALAGLILGAAALVVALVNAGRDTPATGSSPAGAVADYGPEKELMQDLNAHAGEAHANTEGVEVEKYERPDPTLPVAPRGKVKRFEIDVAERVTRVSDEKPALRVWSYAVNGRMLSGTGGSPPIVVNQGDRVGIKMTNGSTDAMQVHFPHSFDTHASEVSPQEAYRDIDPGETLRFRFTAKHPGVFMYHCGTKPVLKHVGAGMAGTMIVKPRGLAAVDRELWLTQQEFYIGKPLEDASFEKMAAKRPDVIAFNGFASQYFKNPIAVRRGERVRIWLLNAGPSLPSYFHVIGTVFDRVWSEGDYRRHAQTLSLGPAEGGFVELTLEQEATYPFVTHAFGDMVRGAIGALRTTGATAAAGASGGSPKGGDSEARDDSEPAGHDDAHSPGEGH